MTSSTELGEQGGSPEVLHCGSGFWRGALYPTTEKDVQMKVGFIGLGRIGLMHVENLATNAEACGVSEIVLFDAFQDRAAQATKGIGQVKTSAASSMAVLLGSVDAVVIATPTPSHPAVLRECVRAGVPTLCEKPVASDLETMCRVVDMVESHSTPVVVGFQRRFDPALRAVKSKVVNGELGEIFVVRSNAYDDLPAPREIILQSDGIYRDLMIHDLDAVPWLVDEPVVEVTSWGSVLVDQVYAEIGDVDFATVTLRFASGALALMVAGRRNPAGYDHRIEVLGSMDSVVQGLGARTPIRSLEPDGQPFPEKPFSSFADRFRAAYIAEITEFIDIAAGRVPNPSPARDSLVSIQLAEACDSSRRSGSAVAIDSVITTG
jgi:myo-inositol 2-dehydrogenase/D-chiro-inositol 1-dehydrogenase